MLKHFTGLGKFKKKFMWGSLPLPFPPPQGEGMPFFLRFFASFGGIVHTGGKSALNRLKISLEAFWLWLAFVVAFFFSYI